jgi:ferredoxin
VTKKRRRRRFSEIEVIETLIHQGIEVPCFRCKVPFTREDVRTKNIQKEHLQELELEGADKPFNCRFSHRDAPCHHTVTNGTPATAAGSSKHRIAKANNATRIDKFVVNKRPLDEPRDRKPKFQTRTRDINAD